MKKSCVKGADYGTFGERLRAWRERKGLSLSECARRSGCSKAWLSQVELGHIKDPSIAKVAPVCQEIGVTVDELFWGPPPVADEERVPDGWYIHGLTHKSLDTYVQRDEPGDQDWYYSDPDELLGLTSTSCGMDETCDLAIAAAQEAADE